MTTTDAPYGRTPKGEPYKTAAAAKRAATMKANGTKPGRPRFAAGGLIPGPKVEAVRSLTQTLRVTHSGDMLARHRAEIADRMDALRPAVDEHARLTQALDALEKVR